ncbi:RpiB/LacA/LacB family sugar-phosphate isomerase [Algibacter sp. R77976]|uniref:RpiB/LacA/LacB family sugar-phosphate isomerase n=1 Tax=Algibacter sp. R77976 TaxID=3093873 RepID=UPI0037CA992D
MKVAIDCDDAAVNLKKVLVDHLKAKGVDVTDLGYGNSKEGSLYPEIGYNLAVKLKEKEFDRGILICGTGLGMAMIANKVEGIFAGTCHDVFSAERIRKSNDAQIITMGERVIGPELAKTVIDAWLTSEFQGGGSTSKVQQMRDLEKDSFHP